VVGRVLLEFGERRLDATIGATLVLHTWTRALVVHPHVHAIVTGGGLALDGTTWRPSERAFLFPIKAMGRVLRGKMIDALKHAYAHGELAGFDDFDDPEGFARLVRVVAKKRWVVYAKPAFDRAAHVLGYLGRYTHRVAISNSRLVDVSDERVTFRTKGEELESITPVEFLRRFVQHVLPDGFHKIRHIGLHASADKRAAARALLSDADAAALIQPVARHPEPGAAGEARAPTRLELTGRDVKRCPVCGGALRQIPLPDARAPPEVAA
jgi:hypothetical protein